FPVAAASPYTAFPASNPSAPGCVLVVFLPPLFLPFPPCPLANPVSSVLPLVQGRQSICLPVRRISCHWWRAGPIQGEPVITSSPSPGSLPLFPNVGPPPLFAALN